MWLSTPGVEAAHVAWGRKGLWLSGPKSTKPRSIDGQMVAYSHDPPQEERREGEREEGERE